MRKSKLSPLTAVLTTAMLLGAAAAHAQQAPAAAADGHKGQVTPAEQKYQGAPSPLASEPMHQATNPKAPPMTQAEFDRARQIYFERCAGCHGVLRK
ncbi:MAG TPA: nitrite reductase, partial [Ottowia beijingensis]|nr:nitrite reductase [Ottowia beijingensis]